MPRAASIASLRDRIRRLEGPVRHPVLPFGATAIDRALPGGGLALGALHEIVPAGADEEDAAIAAGFAAAIGARLETAPILWCLKRPDLYGPGLAAHGLDPARLVLVAASRDEDVLWAMEEGLRMSGLAAVVGEVGRLPTVAGRRLQLAAERSGVPALLLRRWRNAAEVAAERARPSAALTRWQVTALPSKPLPPLHPLSPFQKNPLPPLGREGRVRGGCSDGASKSPSPQPSPPLGKWNARRRGRRKVGPESRSGALAGGAVALPRRGAGDLGGGGRRCDGCFISFYRTGRSTDCAGSAKTGPVRARTAAPRRLTSRHLRR